MGIKPAPQEPIRLNRSTSTSPEIARLRQAADDAANAIERLKLEIEQLARKPSTERIEG